MEKDISRKNMSDVVYGLESSYAIAMNQTQALLEVLRTYFENSMSNGRAIDIPDESIVSFLYQIDDNLEKMGGIVADIIKDTHQAPVKLRLAVG